MQIFGPPEPSLPRRPGSARSAGSRLLMRIRPRLPRAARRPLAGLVAGEVLVCGLLAFAAYRLYQGQAGASPGQVAAVGAMSSTSPAPDPSLAPPTAAPAAAAGPQPGLATGGGFLGTMLQGLNQDDASLERSEWSALQAISGAMRAYLERVVVPAVEKAARENRGGP